jgi:acetyl esterase/lipase
MKDYQTRHERRRLGSQYRRHQHYLDMRHPKPNNAVPPSQFRGRLYLNGADPRTPLAAPIYADLKGLAPLLIQVGACETLLDDALRLAKVAGALPMCGWIFRSGRRWSTCGTCSILS